MNPNGDKKNSCSEADRLFNHRQNWSPHFKLDENIG